MNARENMLSNDYDELIERLKVQAAAAVDGLMVVHESENMDASVREKFWRSVVQFETAGSTDLIKELKAAGVDVPDPDSLTDEALHGALWTIIETLGRMHVHLDHTDHLSDRELYTRLWGELLPEEMPALDCDDDSVWHVDILGGCSEEDIALHLKNYADDATRQHWRSSFPDYDLPDHADPPYDRDRYLPPYEEGRLRETHRSCWSMT
jgi:hypothetical protein